MENILIALSRESELPKASYVLSLAMIDNPIHLAVYQGQGEKERVETEKSFLYILNESPSKIFLAKQDGNIVGVIRMRPCNGSEISGICIEPNDFETRKALWLNEWARRDPVYSHWHLGPLGVLPEYQQNGIGSKLMQRVCDEVDVHKSIAYLETDRERNVRMYKKFGFEVVDESMILDVRNTYMVRHHKK